MIFLFYLFMKIYCDLTDLLYVYISIKRGINHIRLGTNSSLAPIKIPLGLLQSQEVQASKKAV